MRQAAKELLYRTGVTPALLRRYQQPRILMFHGVSDLDLPLPAFQRLVRFLAARFTVIPLSALLEDDPAANRRKPRVALTFDDGLQNNATLAAPCLAAHGLPATFYVCPGLIDERLWVWTYEARARLSRLTPERQNSVILALHAESGGDLERFMHHLKTTSSASRRGLLEALRQRTADFDPSAAESNAFDVMTWAEALQLTGQGHEIGSHTLTHQPLEFGTTAEFEREILGARDRIQSAMGHAPLHFCYPDGRFAAASLQIVRQCHRSGVTTQARLLSVRDDPHLLPRVGAAGALGEMTWRLLLAGRRTSSL